MILEFEKNKLLRYLSNEEDRCRKLYAGFEYNQRRLIWEYYITIHGIGESSIIVGYTPYNWLGDRKPITVPLKEMTIDKVYKILVKDEEEKTDRWSDYTGSYLLPYLRQRITTKPLIKVTNEYAQEINKFSYHYKRPIIRDINLFRKYYKCINSSDGNYVKLTHDEVINLELNYKKDIYDDND